MQVSEHTTVLLREAVDALVLDADGVYVDGTYGRGGHSTAILSKLAETGRLFAFDRDPVAVQHGHDGHVHDVRFRIVQGAFSSMGQSLTAHGVAGHVQGILLDLGVSSPQLDEASRGFSFMQDGPLDMRMDTTQTLNAAVWVNTTSSEEMTRVFREYGEERYARRIALAIEKSRIEKPITRTLELANIVSVAHPAWEKHKHPATRVFQAIRILVNDELGELQRVLAEAVTTLKPGGRLAVIAFHSLEDRIVKLFLRRQSQGVVLPRGVPVMGEAQGKTMKLIGGAIKPCENEVLCNPRSRSAVLRVGEKL